ncbi:hypothetical protein ALP39_200459 [Pseudomonas marginalis pv. marginalis]|nr:hypothetical protein ALP39_200459 [Pseudomonas marginalis pv. marginalis]
MTASPLRGGDENLRQLVVFAEANGWTVSRTRGGHIRFTKPGLGSIHTSSTSSDYRAGLNAKARLRRAERAMPQSIQEEY